MASAIDIPERLNLADLSNSSTSANVSNCDNCSPDKVSRTDFYFDKTPKSAQISPHMKAINSNLNEIRKSAIARNHRIYSIDEISEISGNSGLVLLNEREHLSKVEQILAAQERNRKQRVRKFHSEPNANLKKCSSPNISSRTNSPSGYEPPSNPYSPSSNDSPHYGCKRPQSNLRSTESFRNCRIFIPPQRPKFTTNDSRPRGIFSPSTENLEAKQFYNAFIFDLDVPHTNHSRSSNLAEQVCNSSSRYDGRNIDNNRYKISNRESNTSCCGCFGGGKKKTSALNSAQRNKK